MIAVLIIVILVMGVFILGNMHITVNDHDVSVSKNNHEGNGISLPHGNSNSQNSAGNPITNVINNPSSDSASNPVSEDNHAGQSPDTPNNGDFD